MIRMCAECGSPFKTSPSKTRRYCHEDCRQAVIQRTITDPKAIAARFWSKVDTSGDCWVWTAAVNFEGGYGQLGVGNGHVLAHRYSYEMTYGSIPKGMMVRHKCDNPPCVRPDHLVLGSALQNIQDMLSRGRSHSQQHPEAFKRGQQHPNARFTDADILSMRQSFADGASASELAKQHKLANSSVNLILSGKVWAHLPNPALFRYLETRKIPAPKLLPDQICQIQELVNGGARRVLVAQQFNINVRTISKIVRGEYKP